jgi:hypothetical protein
MEIPEAYKVGIIRPQARQIGGNYYASMKIQPLEFAHANGLGFAEGLVLKYICRHRVKNGREDLDKAIHVLELLRDLEYPPS